MWTGKRKRYGRKLRCWHQFGPRRRCWKAKKRQEAKDGWDDDDEEYKKKKETVPHDRKIYTLQNFCSFNPFNKFRIPCTNYMAKIHGITAKLKKGLFTGCQPVECFPLLFERSSPFPVPLFATEVCMGCEFWVCASEYMASIKNIHSFCAENRWKKCITAPTMTAIATAHPYTTEHTYTQYRAREESGSNKKLLSWYINKRKILLKRNV